MDQAGTLSAPQGARPGPLAIWLQASRAFTLGMPFMSVTVGSFLALYAGAEFGWRRYLVAVVAAMALQAGANLINDYYDFIKGTDLDNWESPDAFGPGLVIQQGLLSAEQIRVGGLIAFASGSILGLGLAYVCGWPILLLGLVGVLGSYFYTAAPLSLAYRGLGDFMVFALMGPGYVLGAYYVQISHFSLAAGLAGISMGLLCSSLLQANNLRDIDNDRRHNKWTVAALIGPRAGVVELVTCDVLAYSAIVLGVVLGVLPWLALLVIITVPRAIDQVRLISRGTSAEAYNRAMARSGQLQFEFGLALVAAFLISRLTGW